MLNMRLSVLDLRCCPECGHFPLGLTELEISSRDAGSSREVDVGYLECERCLRFYFIEEGIPRLLGDGLPA